MRASRGMGCIAPDKMPKAKVKQRKDGDSFTQYNCGGTVKRARGGPVKKK